ncbi:RsiV family protein [Candidatus Mycobacterium wuenschmannii]|uniref:RsiV family protein n=1 Tax=Candidatus Mycobacterium wuenschmannii TaxID=3027808 RepID=A0ABY8VXX0_9MYCO|nr:esterase [Candidatus Mycobacterium wuenschmannii]WIM88141.1 RsiV family protein [Candidatus Mycobacterium wuenschmannii]
MRNMMSAALIAAGALLGWSGVAVAAADSACTNLGGTLQDDQTCNVHTVTPTYTLNMTFPVDYPDQALTDYLGQNRDGFVNVAQTSSQTSGQRDVPYQMEVTSEQFHSGQAPGGTRSVVLKVFEDLGGPRPSTFYKGFNYDVAGQKAITFDTLFPPNAKPLDSIFPIVQREVGKQTGLGAAISPGSGLDASHYQNFAITDDELIFYFAPGELLPSLAGGSQVHVPRNAIPPLAVKG